MQISIHTPLLYSTPLSTIAKTNIWLKMEALQPSGSFKSRGIGYACQHYVRKGAQSLVSSSGGNAGMAVALAGNRMGVPVTVVVPESTKQAAKDQIQSENATLIVHGESWIEAHAYATKLAEQGAAYIHPFDDPVIWEGHASMVDEMLADGVTPDGIILCVGGGGLFCGVVEGLRRNGLDDVPILALETTGAASFHDSVQAGERVYLDAIDTIATTLGAKQVGEQAFAFSQSHPTETALVSDAVAVDACLNFLNDHRVLVEPSCGASLSAVYKRAPFLEGKENIVVIVCGGSGATIQQLLDWKDTLRG
ncbi:MAG: pyridoxal-phosphate dependent enzyme [Candidatus Promineifilaceae bacterium]